MKDVARTIFTHLSSDYYLAGGTALALHIGHRSSIDLDYFSQKPIDTLALKQQIFEAFKEQNVEILFEERNTLWCVIDGVKVSFMTRSDSLRKPVIVEDVFRLASIEDITVMKLSAICGRDEFKDYFDLACISHTTDVRSWVAWWNEVYPHVDITSWVVALGASEMVPVIDLEVFESFKTLNVESRIKSIVTEITNFLR
jgi:predicted nucleotidyltransferase component of viral defense system